MTGRKDLYDESMQLGHSAAWDLQWEKAIGFYNKALAEFPDDSSALTSLALALLETDQLKEALAIYRRAAKIAPEDPVPIERCAEIFERLGQTKEAIDHREAAGELYVRRKDAEKALESWTQVARLAPESLAARSRLALTHERLGRRREAVHEYLAVASILQRAGKTDRAVEAIQRSLALIPGHPDAALASRLLKTGRPLPPPGPPRGATGPLRMSEMQDFLRTEQAEPKPESEAADPELAAQRQALTVLAGLMFEEGKDDGESSQSPGMAALSRGKPSKKTEAARAQITRYLGQSIDLQTRGQKKQAVKELESAIKAGLDHPAAHYNLGVMLKEVGDLDRAKKHLIASVGHPELALGANLALGRLARMQDDQIEAARFLLQALRLADTLSVDKSQSSQLNKFYDTIEASQSKGDTEALGRIVETTLNFLSGPQWLQRLRQARHQLEAQAPGASVVPIAEMFAVGGSDRIFQSLERIDELINTGHLPSAMEEALLALEASPNYLAIHLRMAEILFKSGRHDQAMKKLKAVAETHRIRGEVRQATEVYTRILSFAPVDIPARLRMIELLAQQARSEEALGQFLELADLYRQMAQIEEARKALSDALTLVEQSQVGSSWSLKILHKIGDMDLSRLDWRRALHSYEQIVSLDPGDDRANQSVIDLQLRLGQEDQAATALDRYLELLVKGGRSSEALSLLEEMAREHPGKPALHTRLAGAYRAAGRKADAIAQYDALGEILLDAGRTADAIHTIRTIIDLEPPDAEGYRELLRNLEASK
ncbi:MAG TPA: tetratricopeptide repeat protein [Anaerolineales bacterium]|nr:tetratricopeptide repeat protein [Anaerolineales bacterium]